MCSFALAGNGSLVAQHTLMPWDLTGIITSALGSFFSMGFFFDKKISVGNQMSKNSLLMMFLWALVKQWMREVKDWCMQTCTRWPVLTNSYKQTEKTETKATYIGIRKTLQSLYLLLYSHCTLNYVTQSYAYAKLLQKLASDTGWHSAKVNMKNSII